jgi:hypothetical protein
MTYVVIDEPEFRRELDEATEEHLASVAQAALEAAQSSATNFSLTGAYAQSLDVGGKQGSLMGTSDPAGHIIEWGSTDTAPKGVLRAAAEAVGAQVEDGGPS